MRFDVNLSILYPEIPLLDRPAAAAAAGFDAVELWWPFAEPVPAARDVDDLVEAFGAAGMRLVLLNLDLGDPAAGHHGLVGIAAERVRFHDNVDAAAELVRRLGGSIVNCHLGNVPPGASRDDLVSTAVPNLALAGERVASAGATLVVEALNPVDFPRYGLHRTEDAVALVTAAAGHTQAPIRILFDIYHVQRTEGDLIARIRAFSPYFGHVQLADSPDRRRPGTGEIAFERVLPELEWAGYRGYVGLEYHPSPDPADTFAWLPIEVRRSAGEDAAVARGAGS
jgi:hydroxypyruvate isomerase